MKWYHNDYSEEALAEMQKEAERRVEESRERARLLAGTAFPQAAAPPAAQPQCPPQQQQNPPQTRQNPPGGFAQNCSPQANCPPPCSNSCSPMQGYPQACSNPYPPQQCCPPPCSNQPQNPFSALSDMLSGFGGDKLIILGVLWLLWNEHADVKLLLALAYIML